MTFDEMISLFDYKCKRYFDNYSGAFETKFDLRWNEYKDDMKWRMFLVMPINESLPLEDMKSVYSDIVKKHVYAQIPVEVRDYCHITFVSVLSKGPVKTKPTHERLRFNVGIRFDMV